MSGRRLVPALLGHPDWTVLPADTPLAAPKAAGAGGARAFDRILRER
jgi:hypothetical protein